MLGANAASFLRLSFAFVATKNARETPLQTKLRYHNVASEYLHDISHDSWYVYASLTIHMYKCIFALVFRSVFAC